MVRVLTRVHKALFHLFQFGYIVRDIVPLFIQWNPLPKFASSISYSSTYGYNEIQCLVADMQLFSSLSPSVCRSVHPFVRDDRVEMCENITGLFV